VTGAGAELPVFDPAVFGGTPQAPPVPMVICWDELDPAGYQDTLDGLSRWLGWFRRTYRVPATVFPPCWFTHPGLVEDLGHLWIGWLLSRHPDAGVGMTGLDWDARRDQAIARLREATAITGCTGTRHQPEPPIVGGVDQRLWDEHLHTETQQRREREILRTIVDVVTEHLQTAELRHDLAPGLLADTTADPAAATTDDRATVAARLHGIAENAATTAVQLAADAARTVNDQHDLADRETHVATARCRLAETIATSPPGAMDTAVAGARREWLTAVEGLVPSKTAADRAAAAAATRATSIERRANTRTRPPNVESLLRSEVGADSLGD
jgi:hypothetical protein